MRRREKSPASRAGRDHPPELQERTRSRYANDRNHELGSAHGVSETPKTHSRGSFFSFEMALVIHTIMEDAEYKDAGIVGFKKDTMSTADRHLKPRAQILARAAQRLSGSQFLHCVAQGRHVAVSPLGAPRPLGVASN